MSTKPMTAELKRHLAEVSRICDQLGHLKTLIGEQDRNLRDALVALSYVRDNETAHAELRPHEAALLRKAHAAISDYLFEEAAYWRKRKATEHARAEETPPAP